MNEHQQITFANGRSISVQRVVGTVVHADRSQGVHFSSSGGYSYVGPSGGYVAAPSLTAHTWEQQAIFLQSDDGSETSFDFRGWDIPVRPGSRLAVLMATVGSDTNRVLAVRNMDTAAERWLALRPWAQQKGLLRGKWRIWPSALIALACASLFAWWRSAATAKYGARIDVGSEWVVVAGVVFVPAVVLEWIGAVVVRWTDSEPQQVADMLAAQLRGETFTS